MSRATRDALQAAIQAHITDLNSADDLRVEDWMVSATSIRFSVNDDKTVYHRFQSKMPPHHSLGLAVRVAAQAFKELVSDD